MARSSSFGGGGGGRDSGANSPSGDRGAGVSRGGGRTGGGGVGGTKKAGNATVADHMIATGGIRSLSIPGSGVAKGNYATQDDAYNDYSKAVGAWGTRGLAGRIGAALAGPFVDQNEPMAGNPRSFAGGTYHTSTNPGGIIGGLAPYGTGMALGPAASALYDKAGLPSVWHGGLEQPDFRNGIFGNTPAGYDMGKSFSDLPDVNGNATGVPGAPQGKGDQSGTSMAAFGGGQQAQTPGGAAFGAQPSPTPMTGGNTSGFFNPKIPNHTLPQGFQSAFPNSLSDEDKRLLYAQALGGMG